FNALSLPAIRYSIAGPAPIRISSLTTIGLFLRDPLDFPLIAESFEAIIQTGFNVSTKREFGPVARENIGKAGKQ
ncbi:MAG: hypothetical protein ACFFF9_03545, partial [Candidatus Thorarchaeota archaeon]